LPATGFPTTNRKGTSTYERTIGLAIALSIPITALSQKQPQEFLKSAVEFSDGDLAKLDGGDVTTKTLNTGATTSWPSWEPLEPRHRNVRDRALYARSRCRAA
jgi:hypothetical protein